MKKGRPRKLTVAEQFYVQNNCSSMSMEEICETAGLDVKDVKPVYAKLQKNAEEEERKRKKTGLIRPKTDEFMIKKTMKDKRGVTIMTKEASERGDNATKRASKRKKQSESDSSYIHRPRGEDV